MITNPKYLSRIIATSLAVITWPLTAQETPAPRDKSDAADQVLRMMRPDGERMKNMPPTEAAAKPWRIGLVVAPINDELRNHLDIPSNSGVVVTEALANGPAAKAGIKKNDIILAANGRPVGSLETLRESVEIAAKTGKELRLAAMTKGVRREVTIKPDLPQPPVVRPNVDRAAIASDAKLREQETMMRRMVEQHKTLMGKMEKQQMEMNRMRETIEQLSKAMREMKQASQDTDKKQ